MATTNVSVGTYASNILAASGDIVELQFAAGASDIALVLAGTFSGTVQFEVGLANQTTGVTWTALLCNPIPSGSAASSATAVGTWQASIVGFTHFRFRCSAYASGRVYATINAALAADGGGVISAGAAHQTAVFANSATIKGVSTGTSGQVLTSNGASTDPTYQDAAGGTPGSPDLSIQGASGGEFVGIPGSSFDATSGSVTLSPVGDSIALTLDVAEGENVLIVEGHSTSSGITSVVLGPILTDSAGVGHPCIGMISSPDLDGSNIAGDSAFAIQVNTAVQTGIGHPAEMTSILCQAPNGTSGNNPVAKTGIHLEDHNSFSGYTASGVNAAILIDDQTAGANVYAIKTGLGPVKLGDVLQLTPVAFAGLPATPAEGWIVPITDSNTGTFGATISAGSSTHHGLAYYDGTNWTFR